MTTPKEAAFLECSRVMVVNAAAKDAALTAKKCFAELAAYRGDDMRHEIFEVVANNVLTAARKLAAAWRVTCPLDVHATREDEISLFKLLSRCGKARDTLAEVATCLAKHHALNMSVENVDTDKLTVLHDIIVDLDWFTGKHLMEIDNELDVARLNLMNEYQRRSALYMQNIDKLQLLREKFDPERAARRLRGY